jgi:polyphosphate glucokinase
VSTDRHAQINARAYEIWEREGRPEGQGQLHWEQAIRELDEAESEGRSKVEMLTLGIDIGGSHLKAAILDEAGVMQGVEGRVKTRSPATPGSVAGALGQLVHSLGRFDRVSIGFPGVVRGGVILTAPTLGAHGWNVYDMGEAMTALLGKPVRILNDASVQGLGVIKGSGLECVLTMGTGMGFALFYDGHLAPHMEMSRHPIRKDKTYNDFVGNAALEKIGKKRWNKRMHEVVEVMATVVNYDVLYIGGGNARHIKASLPSNVQLVANSAGITGGVRLWDARMDETFSERLPFAPSLRGSRTSATGMA